jgi:hypothetical protein
MDAIEKPDYVEVHSAEWIRHYGYTTDKKPPLTSFLIRVVVFLCLIPYRVVGTLARWYWMLKYPGHPFIMQKYPSLSSIKRILPKR